MYIERSKHDFIPTTKQYVNSKKERTEMGNQNRILFCRFIAKKTSSS